MSKREQDENKSSKKEAEEVKTLNDLDPRFQLTDKHDAEHIFPEEHEMIAELRNRIPLLRFYSEKFIVYFLCARRHDVDETELLLRRYIEVMEQFKFHKNFPSVQRPDIQEMLSSRHIYTQPQLTDKHGRTIKYFLLSRLKPGTPIETIMAYSYWEVEYNIITETLANLRNGQIWVCDLDGFSLLKNVDLTGGPTKSWGQYMSGTLPTRVRGIYLLNQGMLMRGITQAAKLVLPKKLTQRIHSMSMSQVKEMIPHNNLLQQYGGALPLTDEEWAKSRDQLIKADELVHKVWKERRKKIRAFLRAEKAAAANE